MSDFVTGVARLSYPNLFDPKDWNDGKKPQYSATLIFDPSDDAAKLAALEAAIVEAKQRGKTAKWDGKIPPNLQPTLLDGDELGGEETEGMRVLRAKSYEAPIILDAAGKPVDSKNSNLLYAGCYVQAIVYLSPYKTAGKTGVTAILKAVKFVQDGEPLGNSTSVASVQAAFGLGDDVAF